LIFRAGEKAARNADFFNSLLADARNFGEMLGRAGGGGSGFDVQMKGELAGGRSFSPSPKGK